MEFTKQNSIKNSLNALRQQNQSTLFGFGPFMSQQENFPVQFAPQPKMQEPTKMEDEQNDQTSQSGSIYSKFDIMYQNMFQKETQQKTKVKDNQNKEECLEHSLITQITFYSLYQFNWMIPSENSFKIYEGLTMHKFQNQQTIPLFGGSEMDMVHNESTKIYKKQMLFNTLHDLWEKYCNNPEDQKEFYLIEQNIVILFSYKIYKKTQYKKVAAISCQNKNFYLQLKDQGIQYIDFGKPLIENDKSVSVADNQNSNLSSNLFALNSQVFPQLNLDVGQELLFLHSYNVDYFFNYLLNDIICNDLAFSIYTDFEFLNSTCLQPVMVFNGQFNIVPDNMEKFSELFQDSQKIQENNSQQVLNYNLFKKSDALSQHTIYKSSFQGIFFPNQIKIFIDSISRAQYRNLQSEIQVHQLTKHFCSLLKSK